MIFTRNFAKTLQNGGNYGLKDASCDVESISDGVEFRIFRFQKIRAKIRSKLLYFTQIEQISTFRRHIFQDISIKQKNRDLTPSEMDFTSQDASFKP